MHVEQSILHNKYTWDYLFVEGVLNFATVTLLLQDQGGVSPKFVTTFYAFSLIFYLSLGSPLAFFDSLALAISTKFVWLKA